MGNKLAAIFKYNEQEKKYICDSISLASIDENNNYRIEIGKYIGYDSNIVKEIIYKNLKDYNNLFNNEVEIKDDNKRLAILLFDNEMLSKLGESLGDYTRISSIRYIRDILEKIEIINKKNNIYYMKKNKCKVSDLYLSEIFSVNNFWKDNKENFVEKIEIMNDLSEKNKKDKIITNMLNKIDSDNIIFDTFKFIPDSELENTDFFDNSEDIELFDDKIDIINIINSISKKIVGQDDAIKTLVTNIYYNQVLIDSLNNSDVSELDSRKVSILLDGPSGTGKTAILKEISNYFSLPISIVNANSFSETGYVGPTITDILKDLLNKANGNISLAERGIIVLDEVDKIACNSSINGKDMKKNVQEELLGFISGGIYNIELGKGHILSNSIEFNTSKITFILSGAFTALREHKIKENNSSIGFNNKESKKVNTYIIDTEDYIEYGFMREFFGRIKVITSTKGYTKEDLRKILFESEISPLKNFEKTVRMFGYKGIVYDEEFIDRLCDEALIQNTGARALQSSISNIQNLLLQDLITKQYLGDKIFLNTNLIEKCEKKKVRIY